MPIRGFSNNRGAASKKAMTQGSPAREKTVIALVIGAIGLYFLLVGAGALPIPGGPRNLHGPLWLVFVIGLAFFLAAIAVLLQAFGRANDSGELPAGAPRWMRVVQYLIGVAIFASFGAIGTWIALGPGDREFAVSFGMFSGGAGATIGRAMFGFGAIIVWLCTLAFAVAGARRLLREYKKGPT